MSEEKRDCSIDVARGIGVLLVIIGHLLPGFYISEPFIGFLGILGWMRGECIHDFIYTFHMPLFFVLAGITFKSNNRISRYVKRLLIPYLCWSAIATLFELIMNRDIWLTVVAGNIVRTFIGYGIAPFWFLSALFLSQLIYKWTSSFRIYTQRLIVVLCLLLTIIFYNKVYVMSMDINIYFGMILRTVLRQVFCFVFFCTGTYAGRAYRRFLPRNQGYAIIILMMFFMVTVLSTTMNSGVNLHTGKIGNPILFLAGGLSGSYLIIGLAVIAGQNNILEKIGKASLGIMCIHYKTIPIWYVVKQAVSVIPFNELRFVIQFLALTSISLWLTQLIEQFLPILIGKQKDHS